MFGKGSIGLTQNTTGSIDLHNLHAVGLSLLSNLVVIQEQKIIATFIA